MLDDLRKLVCQANLKLAASGLVMETFGNVSAIDRASGHVVIKPSGVPYERMKPEHMVVVSLASGQAAEGDLRPSSDTPTHLELYRAFPRIGGVAHTHSLYATVWAQARCEIPPFGTTHADFFHGVVPCTRALTARKVAGDYEANTGKAIARRFARLDPTGIPAVLVANHGPFTWGASADEAVDNAVALEYVARLAAETLGLKRIAGPIRKHLLDKHFLRKHGPGAYYGQKGCD